MKLAFINTGIENKGGKGDGKDILLKKVFKIKSLLNIRDF